MLRRKIDSWVRFYGQFAENASGTATKWLASMSIILCAVLSYFTLNYMIKTETFLLLSNLILVVASTAIISLIIGLLLNEKLKKHDKKQKFFNSLRNKASELFERYDNILKKYPLEKLDKYVVNIGRSISACNDSKELKTLVEELQTYIESIENQYMIRELKQQYTTNINEYIDYINSNNLHNEQIDKKTNDVISKIRYLETISDPSLINFDINELYLMADVEKRIREFESRSKERFKYSKARRFNSNKKLNERQQLLTWFGLPANTSDFNDVKRKHRDLAKKYHPDVKNGNSEMMIKVNDKYDKLKACFQYNY